MCSTKTGMKIYNKSLLTAIVSLILLASCEQYQIHMPDGKTSCERCHTDYALLQKVYSPDTEPPASGCGGDAPYYEPFDRVYMGGDGYEAYKQSYHYKIPCTDCHNGDGKSNDKTTSHSGDFIAHPSAASDESCGKCHADIVDNFGSSIHNGMGQMRKVALRSGLSGSDDFDDLPAHQIEGYNKNCATCHGTCGNCHVVRPKIGGGGLSNGHMFNKTPDMVTVCVSCHSSRGGHAYLGVASGTVPDVHFTSEGYKCIDCHKGSELHGNGEKVEQRYAYSQLPACKDCHASLETSNTYHSVHYSSFDCQVCHSQNYNNCGSCHIHGAGARIPAYMDYKIAVNPLPDIKQGFELSLVRRTLAAPDNWKEYDVPEYSDFNILPTYNYTTPHNIQKRTARTTVPEGGACYVSCHIRNEGGQIINKNLYLFMENLLEWEVDATSSITVDGKLPASWFTK
jgi:thiosulfate/3-mercaptopyruvate sulfurtransferase